MTSTNPPEAAEVPASLVHVVKFWNRAAAELQPIQEELASLYAEAGAAAIMEQRALSLGVMVGYLESLMARQPARIAELGSLYSRLVEAERRAYEAHRKSSKPRLVGSSDLASLVK